LLCLGRVVCLICCWFCFSHTREREKRVLLGPGGLFLVSSRFGITTPPPKLGLVTWMSRWIR
jgi:hypothetical protein